MRPQRPLRILAAGATAAALALAAPGLVALACQLNGGKLGILTSGNGYQRDFRIFNNFSDASANDNNTPDPDFPSTVGADQALWKAARVWDSDIGNANALGGANFDFDFQGSNASAGGFNANTISETTTGGTCSGGVLAFAEGPYSDGWRIRFCPSWTWEDGPGCPSGGKIDLQGVGAHELGHCLGLNHTGAGCGTSNQPTMCAGIFSNGCAERTIEADDISCLVTNYGSFPSNKPVITSLAGSQQSGQTLILNGHDFSTVAGGNSVKFTAGTSQNTGTIPGVVSGVSSTGGGTQISVTIPAGQALPGNVLVWIPGSNVLSNPWPIDVDAAPPVINTITPNSVEAFQPPAVTLGGTGFLTATDVTVDGNSVTFLVVDDTQITVTTPNPTALGSVPVQVTNNLGPSNIVQLTYTDTVPPKLIVPATWFPNFPMPVSWGGASGDFYMLILDFVGTTVPFHGFNILAAPFIVTSGTLDAIGYGPAGFTIPIPPGMTGGITVYEQVWTIDPLSGLSSFQASPVGPTLFP